MKSEISTYLLVFGLLLLARTGWAHPGIGMVRDRKGNIYYSDLEQVWRLCNGKKTIAVANVHTHELYLDKDDNLYGEHLWFVGGNNDFKHYLWVLKRNGSFDTVVKTTYAYRQIDFSLARDQQGNQFYVKEFVTQPDTIHLFRKDIAGNETIVATGTFKGIKWLHPQADGSILFVRGNAVHKVNIAANDRVAKAFPFGETSHTLGGAWQDAERNIYVALFRDRMIKKIDSSGAATICYRSPGKWAPVFGLFDKDTLWVLEYSDQNEVRVVAANKQAGDLQRSRSTSALPVVALLSGIVLVGIIYKMATRVPSLSHQKRL